MKALHSLSNGFIGLCTIVGVASCLYLCFDIMILDEPITKQSIVFL